MRWNNNNNRPTIRHVRRFLFLPVTVPMTWGLNDVPKFGETETRWLEWATIRQVYNPPSYGDSGYWTNERFLEEGQ